MQVRATPSLPVLALAAALACSQPPAADDREGPAPGEPEAGAAAAQPGDGVLAEVAGATGPIRVEQRAGRRLLFIGGTLHASVAWAGDAPDPAVIDPLVGLVRAVRPAARTALVIGLGSGDTAGDLARAGVTVTAVEIDPAVIEVARTWFGYRGDAVAGDGLAYLESATKTWDLVVMDAFAGTRPPPPLVTPRALKLLRARTAPGGATALRLLAEPRDPAVKAIREGLGGGRTFGHLFGSGVGAEQQNLYVIAADAPLNLAATAGLALWPVPDDVSALDAVAPGQGTGVPATEPRPSREVTLVGYLHRLAGGELALDLPHAEMGAVRYLLTGKPAAPLAGALPDGASFPTMGDIPTDGDTSQTLRPLLGGGGAKRSDLRFSPVVAAVTGSARLLALVHPDAASKVPASVRGAAATDDRIPYGGALYELVVSRVHWTMDRAGWTKAAPELDRHAAAAAKAAARGDLAAAAPSMQAWADTLAARLGARAELVAAVRSARAFAQALTGEATRAASRGTPFALAAACDRLHQRHGTAIPPAVAGALLDCAVGQYQRTIAAAPSSKDADAYDAAARLAHLLDGRDEKRRRALMKQFKIAQPMLLPPGSF